MANFMIHLIFFLVEITMFLSKSGLINLNLVKFRVFIDFQRGVYVVDSTTLNYWILLLVSFVISFVNIGFYSVKRKNYQSPVTSFLLKVFIANLLHYLVLLQTILQVCYNNGIRSLPSYFYILYILTIQMINPDIKYKVKFKFYLTQLLKYIMLFFMLILYLANVSILKKFFMKQNTLNYFGKAVIQDSYDFYREVINLTLFILVCFHSHFLKSIIENKKRKKRRRSSLIDVSKFQDKWYFYFSKQLYQAFLYFSDKMVELSLMIWGMSRISLIKFSFLLIGIFGILSKKQKSKFILYQFAFILANLYLVFQNLYNLSFIDQFLKSLGKKTDEYLFKVGLYKYYNLFHGHLLKFQYDYDEIKIKRKNGMIWDMTVFCMFFLLYVLVKKQRKNKKQQLFQLKDLQNLSQKAIISFFNNLIVKIIQFLLVNMNFIVVIIILFISSMKQNILHLIYLIILLYQVLVFKINHFANQLQIYIKLIGTILILIYCYHLFEPNIGYEWQLLIGLSKIDDNLFNTYKEHFYILLILLISQKFIQIQDYFSTSIKQNYSISFRKEFQNFIIKHHCTILFLIISLMLIIPPYNIFALTQILILINYRTLKFFFKKEKQLKFFQKLIFSYWMVILILSLLGYYMFNIQLIQLQNLLTYVNFLNTKSFGYTLNIKNRILYLMTNGFLIIFMRYLYFLVDSNKILKKKNTRPILYELGSDDDFHIRKIKDPNKWLYSINQFWQYLQMFKTRYLLLIFILTVFYFCVIYNTLATIVYLIIILLSLYSLQGFFSKYQWILIYFVSIVFLILQYSSQLVDQNWLMKNFELSLANKVILIDSPENINIYYLFIIFLCCLFKNMNQNKMMMQSHQQIKEYLNEKYFCIPGFKSNLKNFRIFHQNREKNKKQPFDQEQIDFMVYQTDNYISYYSQKSIFKMNMIFNKVELVFKFFLLPISLFSLMIVCFIEQNILSIPLFILCLICSRVAISSKNTFYIKIAYKIIFIVIAVILTYRLYFVLYPKFHIFDYLTSQIKRFQCPLSYQDYYSKLELFEIYSDYENCHSQWDSYLLQTQLNKWIALFYCLVLYKISTTMNNSFSKNQIQKLTKQITLNISVLLESHKTQFQELGIIKKFGFFWLPQIVLFLFFLCGTMSNLRSSQGDLVGLIYSITGLVLMIGKSYDRKESKRRILSILEYLNFFFMMIMIIFQLPLFGCPIYMKNRKYYTVEECIYLHQNNQQEFFLNKDNQSLNLYYSFTLNTLGLIKFNTKNFLNFSKQMLMILFFFIGIMIHKIWDMDVYNDHIKSRKLILNKKRIIRASKYVFKSFLENYWAYQKYQTKKKNYGRRNQEIDNKINKWEDRINQKQSQVAQQLINEEKKSLMSSRRKSKKSDYMKKNDESIFEAEKILNSFSSKEPILDLDTVAQIIKEEKEEEKIAAKLRDKQISLLKRISQHLIDFDQVNLDFLRNKNNLLLLNMWDEERNMIDLDNLLVEQIETIPTRYKEQELEYVVINNTYWDQVVYIFNVILQNIKSLLIVSLEPFYRYNAVSKTILNQNSKLIPILNNLFIQYSQYLVYFIVLINVLSNGDVVSLIPCIIIFLFGIVASPFPHHFYWRILIYYIFLVIIIKMIYQLPIFCTTTPYTLIFSDKCENTEINYYFLYSRIDYLIGIKKFYGKSSFPKNIGILRGLFYDYLTLITLLFHRSVLKKQGILTYLTSGDNQRNYPIINSEKCRELFRSFGLLNQEKNVSTFQDNSSESSDFDDSFQSESMVSKHNSMKDSLEDSEIQEFIVKYKVDAKMVNVQKSFIDHIWNFIYRIIPLPVDIPKFIIVKNLKNPFETLQYEPLFLRTGKNLYKQLFLLEISLFLIFIFCYDILIGSSTSFSHALQKSQFSEDMVIIILKLFSIILINRICYIKRSTVIDHKILKLTQQQQNLADLNQHNEIYQNQSSLAKYNLTIRYFLHFLVVLYIHYFFFIEVPYLNKNLFMNLTIAKIVYLIFFCYLMISALQIQKGYSDIDIDNPYTNEISFWENMQRKIFHSIPFIFEIKSVLDWTMTYTSLDLYQWFKLEDAYINLKFTKYQMLVRKYNPIPIDFQRKFTFGFCFLLFLFGIIILPIILFSTLNPNYIINEPQKAEIKITLWTSQGYIKKQFEIFSTQDVGIQNIDSEEFDREISHLFKMRKSDKLTQFKKLLISSYSYDNWNLSPPNQKELTDLLKQKDTTLYLTASWKIFHDLKKGKSYSYGSNTVILSKEVKRNINQILQSPNEVKYVKVEDVFPKMIYLNSSQYLVFKEKDHSSYSASDPIQLAFKSEDQKYYWEAKNNQLKMINFYIHCDYIMGNILGDTLRDMSVIGFYVTIVLAIGQLIKSIFVNTTMKVIYEEMPNTNQLIEFCESIYMARKEKDLMREKRLYDLLIRIYRSPELLLQLTAN